MVAVNGKSANENYKSQTRILRRTRSRPTFLVMVVTVELCVLAIMAIYFFFLEQVTVDHHPVFPSDGGLPIRPTNTLIGNKKSPASSCSSSSHFAIRPARRTRHFDTSKTVEGGFSFVHVSKCAGASWINELKTLLGTKVYPEQETGVEHSVLYQQHLHAAKYTLMSVRSPLHHVWSMYSECRHGFGTLERLLPFPKINLIPMSDDDGFDFWLDHFVIPANNNTDGALSTVYLPNGTDNLKCYHPSNFQSAFLTTTAPNPQNYNPDVGLEPNVTNAIQVLQKLDWVALQDFHHESKCLLYFRLLEGVPLNNNQASKWSALKDTVGPDKRNAMLHKYLDETCHCNDDAGHDNKTDVHVLHHAKGRRQSMLDLSANVLAKVHALTHIDRAVYKVALEDFLQEVVWLEQVGLKRTILCTPKLQSTSQELAYLDVNVTNLYLTYSHQEWCSHQAKNRR